MISPVTQIKERLSIEEVVSTYIKLDRVGSSLKARCPFHNEKSPSFFVSNERGSYYCFGCGAKGDIFTFVEEFEGLDFKGALKLLAEKAGVSLSNFNLKDEGQREKLYRVMEEAKNYFVSNLEQNKKAYDYVLSRGINEISIKDFSIGFAQNDWKSLLNYLKNKGFTEKEIEQAGLIKQGEKKGPSGEVNYYDRFRSRIMFPISDSSGRTIAFSGRIFEDGLTNETVEKSAKYLNSPDTPIFYKSNVLYGLDKAKESIRKNNFSILVEGQMDLVLSHQAGFRNTIATSGTALADPSSSKENAVSNLGLVRRLSGNIVLAFDADKAGINASSRAGKIALSLGMDTKVANLPDGVDPADLINNIGAVAWKNAIKNAKHIIEFMLNKVIQNAGGDTRKIGREIKEKILPYVNALNSTIEKAHFLKRISDMTSIPLSAIEDDFKAIKEELKYDKKETEDAINNENKLFRKDYILRRLIGIIFWQQNKKESKIDVDETIEKIANILNISKEKLLDNFELNKEDLIYEAEVFYGEDDFKKDAIEMLYNLEEEHLKEELAKKMRELYNAEEEKDENKSREILKDCQIINNKIESLKNGRLK